MVADLAAKTGAPIRFKPWRGVFRVPGDADILINATSIVLYPDLDASRRWICTAPRRTGS